LKILFISPRYSGGIGGHAAMLASQLTKHNFEVKMMHVPHIPIKNLKNPSFAVFGTLKGLLSNEKFDIVHGFNVPSAFAMKYAKGKKKVLSIHGVFSEQVKALHSNTLGSIATVAESKALHWADKLTTDSKISQKEYQKKLGLDFEYMPSAIDTTALDKVPEVKKEENQIVYVGRDSYEKGIDVLKNAEQKIKGKIVYCTNMPWLEAMKTLKASSLIIVPSRMESLPTNIKEAFYLKIPVLATNVGGIPELVSHNETGILIPSDDSDKLAEAANHMLQNKELCDKLAAKAYEFVTKSMTWKVVLPKYIKFYEDLLN
jgi:glycosyltransferase involved in cell wall biosynthesis